MPNRHAGIIRIDDKTLLKMLDFEGATIHRVYKPDHRWLSNETYLLIEHPDLPEVFTGDHLVEIVPIHRATYGQDGSIIQIERIDPPKKARIDKWVDAGEAWHD